MFRGTAVTPVLYDRYSLVPGREESVPGFRLADSACRLITLPVGTTVEGLWQKTAGVRLDDRWMHLAFTFHVPTGEPGYSYYHVELVQDSLLYYLWLAGVIIATLEVLVMARRAVEIHKRTLRILQPITDLTLAAQSVGLGAGLDAGFGAGAGGGWGAGSGFGAGGAAAAAGRGEEPRLKVSGAIDALNAINELHLDRRVSIDDERVELKGLAQAINGMLDRIAAAYRSQLRFVSDASHELRTPIAVIQGYANLLDRWGKNDPKALQESIDAIKNEAEGMKLLVEQLLFLARGDNRGIALALERADLALVVGEAAREAEMIDGGRHEYRAAIEPGLSVLGDVALIKQAARIFIENSIKYTPEGGRITVRAWRREGGGVSFSVTDSGIGIPAEALPHVFERFFRADESRARKTGGTGLGLSIAKWIVDAHGGSIEVLSRVDAGTRFTVTFPGADAAPGDAAPDSAEAGLGDAAPAADAPDGAAPGAAAASAPSPPAPDAATGPDGGEGSSPPAA
jgi:signal transduction histidine kinase